MSKLMQSIQPKDPRPGQTILVTFKNHKWAASVLGMDEAEVLAKVQEANREDVVLAMKVPIR